ALAVVVGDQGTILTSSNGTAWTKRPSGTTDKLVGVAYHEQSSLGVSNRVYLAIGESGTTVLSYDNGSNWTATANNFGRKVRSLTYAGNTSGPQFIAVGENGLVATTGDYTNWAQGKMDADFSNAVYGNGRWAVVGPYY